MMDIENSREALVHTVVAAWDKGAFSDHKCMRSCLIITAYRGFSSYQLSALLRLITFPQQIRAISANPGSGTSAHKSHACASVQGGRGKRFGYVAKGLLPPPNRTSDLLNIVSNFFGVSKHFEILDVQAKSNSGQSSIRTENAWKGC